MEWRINVCAPNKPQNHNRAMTFKMSLQPDARIGSDSFPSSGHPCRITQLTMLETQGSRNNITHAPRSSKIYQLIVVNAAILENDQEIDWDLGGLQFNKPPLISGKQNVEIGQKNVWK